MRKQQLSGVVESLLEIRATPGRDTRPGESPGRPERTEKGAQKRVRPREEFTLNAPYFSESRNEKRRCGLVGRARSGQGFRPGFSGVRSLPGERVGRPAAGRRRPSRGVRRQGFEQMNAFGCMSEIACLREPPLFGYRPRSPDEASGNSGRRGRRMTTHSLPQVCRAGLGGRVLHGPVAEGKSPRPASVSCTSLHH